MESAICPQGDPMSTPHVAGIIAKRPLAVILGAPCRLRH
jgi:hypothetical protein